jgi:hypothetical protein
LALVKWDPILKLGEHEDFFYRASMIPLRILSCGNISIIHNQSKWWKIPSNEYTTERKRVFDYIQISLLKNDFKTMETMGHVTSKIK